MLKRIFDIIFSFFGLILVLPVLAIIAFFVKLGSEGSVFYRGLRVGKDGKKFRIFKFRTLVAQAEKMGGPSTSADDPRMTKVGAFLRKSNLDELPQLIDVLRGKMSFVGPRPEVPQEVETYDEETKNIILSVRPGMTDLATLANVHEEEILKGSDNPHKTYQEIIKPQKIKLAKEYVKTRSFFKDIEIILKTLKSVIS